MHMFSQYRKHQGGHRIKRQIKSTTSARISSLSRWKTTKSATPCVAQQRQNFTLSCLSRRGKGLQLGYQSDLCKPLPISVMVRNRSPQPAHYAFVKVGIDTELHLHTLGDFFTMQIPGDAQQQHLLLGHRFMAPPAMPIFKEIEQD